MYSSAKISLSKPLSSFGFHRIASYNSFSSSLLCFFFRVSHLVFNPPSNSDDSSNKQKKSCKHEEPVVHSGRNSCFILAIVALVVVSAAAFSINTNSSILALPSTVLNGVRLKHDIGALVDLPSVDFPLPLESARVASGVFRESKFFALERRDFSAAGELSMRISRTVSGPQGLEGSFVLALPDAHGAVAVLGRVDHFPHYEVARVGHLQVVHVAFAHSAAWGLVYAGEVRVCARFWV